MIEEDKNSIKAITKEVIKEEMDMFKKVLIGEAGKAAIKSPEFRNQDAADQIRTSKLANVGAKQADRFDLSYIKKNEKSDFIAWIMRRFGKNIPSGLTSKEVEEKVFSGNIEDWNSLNIGIDNPDTMAKLWITKNQLNRALGTQKMASSLAKWDAYEAAQKAKETGKTATGRDKSIVTGDTGGETLDVITPTIGQKSKQRTGQHYDDAYENLASRLILGKGSIKEAAAEMEDIAMDATEVYIKLLTKSVEFASKTKEGFTAQGFFDEINDVLGRKPDYSVETATTEELTAIQSFGDDIADALRTGNASKLEGVQAEIMDMLMDDFAGKQGPAKDPNFLAAIASVIRNPKIQEFEPKAREEKDQFMDRNYEILGTLRNKLADLETEELFYEDMVSLGGIEPNEFGLSKTSKEDDAKKKIAILKLAKIQKDIEDTKTEMAKTEEAVNMHLAGGIEHLELKYTGGNVMKTFQQLVAKMVDNVITGVFGPKEKEKLAKIKQSVSPENLFRQEE